MADYSVLYPTQDVVKYTSLTPGIDYIKNDIETIFGPINAPKLYAQELDTLELASSGKVAFTLSNGHALDLLADGGRVLFRARDALALTLATESANVALTLDETTDSIDAHAASNVAVRAGADIRFAAGRDLAVAASNAVAVAARAVAVDALDGVNVTTSNLAIAAARGVHVAAADVALAATDALLLSAASNASLAAADVALAAENALELTAKNAAVRATDSVELAAANLVRVTAGHSVEVAAANAVLLSAVDAVDIQSGSNVAVAAAADLRLTAAAGDVFVSAAAGDVFVSAAAGTATVAARDFAVDSLNANTFASSNDTRIASSRGAVLVSADRGLTLESARAGDVTIRTPNDRKTVFQVGGANILELYRTEFHDGDAACNLTDYKLKVNADIEILGTTSSISVSESILNIQDKVVHLAFNADLEHPFDGTTNDGAGIMVDGVPDSADPAVYDRYEKSIKWFHGGNGVPALGGNDILGESFWNVRGGGLRITQVDAHTGDQVAFGFRINALHELEIYKMVTPPSGVAATARVAKLGRSSVL